MYFNFEDERLAEMTVAELQWVVEEYYTLCPEWRDRRQAVFFLDEIQVVAGWEGFVRRVLDTERVEIFLSGSSARLLSCEVATQMRGRAMEALVLPFSFRECLRHAGAEPATPPHRLTKSAGSAVEKRLREYLVAGGFPEAQGLASRDRLDLLRGYVDTALFRDVVERHAVSNPVALRWMVRRLLGQRGWHVQRAAILRRSAVARHSSRQGHPARLPGPSGGRLSHSYAADCREFGAPPDGESSQGLPCRSRPDPGLRPCRTPQRRPRLGDGRCPGTGTARRRGSLRANEGGISKWIFSHALRTAASSLSRYAPTSMRLASATGKSAACWPPHANTLGRRCTLSP